MASLQEVEQRQDAAYLSGNALRRKPKQFSGGASVSFSAVETPTRNQNWNGLCPPQD
ncbi:hypothetical protein BOSEA31B_13747 [Hyphomicrobiales bacterium]|nr:hypothetical protein BOSEA31B_13747 [Hyphomicrobiales bacterium]CAH1699518.1 hypothetical protein BOSEA1005_12571 [Hyphomicrobiales bacterium]CAI0343305.1 hypothetical protein BO1005MUT1_220104 [Hyphomicrobiales bacterium]